MSEDDDIIIDEEAPEDDSLEGKIKEANRKAGGGGLGETVQDDGSILIADAEGGEVATIPAVGTNEDDVIEDDEVD